LWYCNCDLFYNFKLQLNLFIDKVSLLRVRANYALIKLASNVLYLPWNMSEVIKLINYNENTSIDCFSCSVQVPLLFICYSFTVNFWHLNKQSSKEVKEQRKITSLVGANQRMIYMRGQWIGNQGLDSQSGQIFDPKICLKTIIQHDGYLVQDWWLYRSREQKPDLIIENTK